MRAHILIVISCGLLVAGFTPIDDVPYPETVAHRFTAQGQPTVPNWGTVPWFTTTQVEAGSFGSEQGAFVVNSSGFVHFVSGPDGSRITVVSTLRANRVAVSPEGVLHVLASETAVFFVNCSMAVSITCMVTSQTQAAFGAVADVALVSVGSRSAYVAAANGLFFVHDGTAERLTNRPTLSVAFSPVLGLAAAGDNDWVYMYSGDDLVSQEWVTDLANAWGGAYDGPARDMDFAADGTLYLANPVCINVRYPNASIERWDWLQGLPVNETTSVAVGPDALWVGTTRGVAKRDFATGEWSYFYLQRYLPGKSSVVDLALAGPSAYVTTDGGLAVLETQMWTLARKAALFEQILLARHDRVGLVTGCDMSSFGDLSSCACHDDDNNGLWTSLVVAAEAFRYNVTRAPDALASAKRFYNGMRLLNAITGIPGLMARSAVRPGESHGGGEWHSSTVPQYAGWQWKGDTSSDEVVGHMFGLPIMAELALSGAEQADAISLVQTIVSYIVKNNFYLIDVTGHHTLWGVWNPVEINFGRNYSDERGVNPLQILAYLTHAKSWSDPGEVFAEAYDTLTDRDNHYHINTLNAKIESPDDDNYSDDELMFLPYYTLFSAPPTRDDRLLRSGMDRSWSAIRSLRSDLWNAIYVAMGGKMATQDDIDSIAWNLRTWPLELIMWPVKNSHRQDLRLDTTADRFGHTGHDSVRVLPANERSQDRWNGNPHDLDGGDGLNEADPGAWLLPYWMARYHRIIRN